MHGNVHGMGVTMTSAQRLLIFFNHYHHCALGRSLCKREYFPDNDERMAAKQRSGKLQPWPLPTYSGVQQLQERGGEITDTSGK